VWENADPERAERRVSLLQILLLEGLVTHPRYPPSLFSKNPKKPVAVAVYFGKHKRVRPSDNKFCLLEGLSSLCLPLTVFLDYDAFES
jgi:hypothetical protein